MQIRPDRVLDVGVGFGRWGMIVREFCDVWSGHALRSTWKVWIEGVEAFPPNIDIYHNFFYDKIHMGDFRKVVCELQARWNLIIFGDVLEHFEKQEAVSLLKWALDCSDYVLVNVPLGSDWPQDRTDDNKYERHLSVWNAAEFCPFPVCWEGFFQDYIGRPFGSFILSHKDPKNLGNRMFPRNAIAEKLAGHQNNFGKTDQEVEAISLQMQMENLKNELRQIRNSRGYRMISGVKNSSIGPVVKRIVKWMFPG